MTLNTFDSPADQTTGIGMTSMRTRKRLQDQLEKLGVTSSEVLSLIGDIPRHLFVEEALAHRAYENSALPIGLGQTISQPYIVAKMTAMALRSEARHKVLEIGTGCGYQTAFLSRCFKQVYTVERIKALQDRAKLTLERLNYRNVFYSHSDGSIGVKSAAPFDVIVVTAGCDKLPEALLPQLKVGGRMILPLFDAAHNQQMLAEVVRGEENFTLDIIEPVRFVPLITGEVV